MEQVRTKADAFQCFGGGGGKKEPAKPGKGKDGSRFAARPAGFEETVSRHKECDQSQQKDCVRRSGVARRLKHETANYRHQHAHEDYCRGVVCDESIEPGWAGAGEKQRNCVDYQDDEAGEDQDVQDTGAQVTWMAPLAEPVAEK